MQLRGTFEERRQHRFEGFKIVFPILLAGWIPSILTLIVSYTILRDTLESRILRDRQTLIQLVGHLVGHDLSRSSGIINYYQTLPEVAKILSAPNPTPAPQAWLSSAFYSHPNIDGMFFTAPDGTLIASIPTAPEMIGKDFGASHWREQAAASDEAVVSPVHPRLSDKRLVTDIVAAVRAPDRTILGYIGDSVLVERIGRRLSTIEFSDRFLFEVLDQNGAALFAYDFKPNPSFTSSEGGVLIKEILANMPSGIAFVDPKSRRFLQANDAFAQMAQRFGDLPPSQEITEATYDDVKIAPTTAIDRVLSFGTPFQLVEHPLKDKMGMTHFLDINLLRLQGPQETIQGVLYLVEDKTRDVRLRQELIGANAAKDQFLALLPHELRNPLSPVIAMVGELEANVPDSAQVREALEVIRRNVELEARLLDDLLDFTRIAKGKLQLSFETVCVHEIIHRAYEICREDIAAKSLKVEFRLRAADSYVE